MAARDVPPRQIASSDLGFAYLMTGIAVGSIFVSGIFGSIFCPEVVSGPHHDHFAIGPVTGWIWGAIALAIFLPVAMRGIRARVADRAPWTMLGLGVSVLWFGSMFITIFAPVWVYGTDPEQFPFTAGIGALAAVILTAILCNVVKTGSFQPAESKTTSTTTTPTVGPEPTAADATVKLGRLGQLRDSGVITEAEFQAKKDDLLTRV